MRTVMLFGFLLGALSAAEKVIVSKLGQTAKFKCETKPPYHTLEWRYGGKMIYSVDGQTGLSRKGKEDIAQRSRASETNLEVSDVRKEDAGEFTCLVDRKPQQHTLLVVSVSVNSPGGLQLGSEATLQCEVKGLTSDATVKWKRPDGSVTGSGIVQLNPVEQSHDGTWECLFNHNSETYTESLSLVVKEPVPEPIATTPTKKSDGVPPPACDDCGTSSPPLLELSWWIWVAIGVGSLIVILLLVVVIIMCKRIRRKKRKHHMRQNGHQPLRPRQFCQCNRPTAAAAKPQQGRRREKPLALPRQPLLME